MNEATPGLRLVAEQAGFERWRVEGGLHQAMVLPLGTGWN